MKKLILLTAIVLMSVSGQAKVNKTTKAYSSQTRQADLGAHRSNTKDCSKTSKLALGSNTLTGKKGPQANSGKDAVY